MASIRALVLCGILFASMNISAKKTAADCKQPMDAEILALNVMKALPPPTSQGCADASKLKGICDFVYRNAKAPEGSSFEYYYEKQINEAACVNEEDSETTAATKISQMWSKLEEKYLSCDTSNFEVPNGSILKYSVSLRNWQFLITAADMWKVNLNKLDPSDNQTLLDYVQVLIERNKSDPGYHDTLTMYYKTLKKMGAKHRSEL